MIEAYILSNIDKVTNVLMIIAFLGYCISKRASMANDHTLLEAIKISLVAAIIPNIFILILCGFDQNYLKYINNQFFILIGLILIFYVYRMFKAAFRRAKL